MASGAGFAKAIAKDLHLYCGVDFGVERGFEDKQFAFDPKSFRLSDTQTAEIQVMLSKVIVREGISNG